MPRDDEAERSSADERQDLAQQGPRAPTGGRSRGLPVLSTEPLTAGERTALGRLIDLHRLVGVRLEEALDGGKVAGALEATNLAERVGQAAGELSALLGSNR